MVDDTASGSHDPRLSLRRELLERTVHDLKNPLAVVRATLEWLEVEVADRAEILDAVHDAGAATGRMMTIVDDLDMLARLEAGEAIAREPVDVVAIVATVVAVAGDRFASRRVEVSLEAAGRVDVVGDAALLSRSLEALVDACARGATAGACVEITARVVPRGEAGTGRDIVEVAVGLRGVVGTAPAASSLEALSSSGLGVYLALRAFEAHGGSVVVVPTDSVPRVIARLPC
jgi:signal transduction histidine kinase